VPDYGLYDPKRKCDLLEELEELQE